MSVPVPVCRCVSVRPVCFFASLCRYVHTRILTHGHSQLARGEEASALHVAVARNDTAAVEQLLK
eukprot:6257-Eustigmatos_ZCMA.PRE.1